MLMLTTNATSVTQNRKHWNTQKLLQKVVTISTPWRHTGGAAEVYLHSLLTSALDGSDWSTSRPGRFTYGQELQTPQPVWAVFEGKKTNYSYIQLNMITRNSSWLHPYCTGVKHGFSSSYEGHRLRCLEQRVQKKVWSPTGQPERLQEVKQWRIYVIRANKSWGRNTQLTISRILSNKYIENCSRNPERQDLTSKTRFIIGRKY
jgi:hypothetical protein